MRGGFLHNSVLLDPIEKHFSDLGAEVHREFRIPSSRILGFVDLYVELGNLRVCCEAELSPDRVFGDVRKAIEVAAVELLIVVPHAGLARSIRNRLKPRPGGLARPRIVVLPLGAALHHVRNAFPFSPPVIPPGKTTAESTPRGCWS